MLTSKPRTYLLCGALAVLAGCVKPAETTGTTTNSEFRIERLFEVDGCKVYRFYDARYRYFTNCAGGVNYTESCGKNCSRNEEIPTAVNRHE